MKALFCTMSLMCCIAAQAAPIEVVTDDSLPPFSFSQGVTAAGIDVDMLTAAAKIAHVEVNITALPWKRVLFMVEMGKAQLGMPLFKNSEREAFAVFIAPVHYSMTGLFVKKGKEFSFQSIDDLLGKTIGYNRGFALTEELDRAIGAGKIRAEEVSATDQNVKKLLFGRIDVFVANTVNTQYVVKDMPEAGQISVLPKNISERRAAYLVASKNASLPEREKNVAALAGALDRLYRDGTYERIVKKYTQ